MTVRVGLFAASPVFYQAPLYRLIAADPRVDFTAVFASDEGARRGFASGFSAPVDWGVDALSGFESVFLRKASRNPTGGGVTALRDVDVFGHVWRARYDVLWLHGYHTATHMLAAAAQRLRGGAVLYREEQTLLTPRAAWKAPAKQVVRRALFRGSLGLYIGSENRRWFERAGVSADRLFHVPYAVDNDRLRARAETLRSRRDQLQREFGLPVDQPAILMLGRLIEQKQPLEVVRAFAAVRRERACSLLVVGTGPLEAALRELVAKERIPDVAFAGFLDQTQIDRAYAAADVFVLFSKSETWGIVVHEAMNFGLPIVVSDRVGCAPDLVVEGGNGHVVPHGDREALARTLGRLLDSEEERRRLGRASVSIVDAYTYDRAYLGLVSAVARAVGAERWPAPTPTAAAI